MKDQPFYNNDLIHHAEAQIDRLKVSLDCIEAYFKHLPYYNAQQLNYILCYGDTEPIIFNNIDEICRDLKRCIRYQVLGKSKINIPAVISFELKVFLKKKEIDLFYNGSLILWDWGGWVLYSWYQSSPMVDLGLNIETKANDILLLFVNFQEAIKDQIEKRSTEELLDK